MDIHLIQHACKDNCVVVELCIIDDDRVKMTDAEIM